MRALIITVLYAALCCGLSDGQANIETLMDNVLVLRVPDGVNSRVTVPLTCGAAYQNQPVVWKKNGVLEPTLQGNQVNVMVEEMNGGNFTCHLSADGESLNHTVIFIQLDPDNRTVILQKKPPTEGGHIHCSAPNYRGSFHCTWTRTAHRSNAAVLLVKAERHLDKIPCELDGDGNGVRCEDANCPYKEEQHRIILTVYIYSFSRLEAYTKTFYMREIVRPEKLPLHSTDGKVFSWSYPESWEKPCTYFGLQFEAKVVPHEQPCDSTDHIMHNTTDKTELEISVRQKKYVFCVRAQDKHTSGPFSHWSRCKVNKQDVQC